MPYATVCPGLLYSLSGAAIQSVWGVSTIKLGRLYSLSVLAVQFDCNYNTKKMAYMNQTLKNKKSASRKPETD